MKMLGRDRIGPIGDWVDCTMSRPISRRRGFGRGFRWLADIRSQSRDDELQQLTIAKEKMEIEIKNIERQLRELKDE